MDASAQTIVGMVLAFITSPIIMKIYEHIRDSNKGRLEKRQNEVKRALLEAEKFRVEAERRRYEIYKKDEAYAILRVKALNSGIPPEELPEWPSFD